MYPAELFALFPPHPRSNVVFVAMSFDSAHEGVWRDVISPAISETQWMGERLKPHRVNLTLRSDSIITEIIQSISTARLVVADISTVGWMRGSFLRKRPVRNANVMYEAGLAHAARLPEEVILIRGDSDPLDFDVAGVRVHAYPRRTSEALELLKTLLVEGLKSVDDRRTIAVKQVVRSLDLTMYLLLQDLHEIPHPSTTALVQAIGSVQRIAAINRLLSAGMLEIVFKEVTAKLLDGPVEKLAGYRSTPFGRAVFAAAREEQNFGPGFQAWLKTPSGSAWLESHKAAAGVTGDGAIK
jgi:hypothetical protein